MLAENDPSVSPLPVTKHLVAPAASQAPAHPVTNLAGAKLPKSAMPPEQELTITAPVHLGQTRTKPPARTAPPLRDATIEEIKKYLVDWVMENPQPHHKETAKKIIDFLASLETKNPQSQLQFDHTTGQLPDIFHTRLVADHLKTLVIHSDKITELPSFGPLNTRLIHLDLRGCTGLTELPTSLGALSNLVRLDLNGCTGLTALPEEIADLDKVTIVGLGDCSQLAALPQALLNKPMGDGQTLLTRAVIEKNENGVRLLQRLGASLSRSAGDGHTPMTRAVAQDNLAMVRLLASLGANVNQVSNDGDTPLICAVREQNSDIVEVLLDELNADINQLGGDGSTPLITAMLEDDTEMVQWLISKGANAQQLSGDGYSPLGIAILHGKDEMVKTLHGHVNFNKPANLFGETPLIIAAINNKPEMVKLLKRLGAGVSIPGADGLPPIAKAMLYDLPGMAHLLKTLGANQEAGERIVKIKFLAHVWGMKGIYQTDTSRFALEELVANYSMRMLEKYVAEFFKSEDFLLDPSMNHALSPASRKKIQEVIAQGFPLSPDDSAATIDQVQSGKPFLILGGTIGHAVSMVLYDDMLVLFNRGEGKAGDAVRSYHLPAAALTPEIIEKLTYTRYPNTKSFYDMLDALKLTPADWGYDQKPQGVSNCAWASAKGAFGILCKLFADSEGAGELIYKKFSTFVRKQAFEEFQLEYAHQDTVLIQQVQAKGRRKGIFPAIKEKTKETAA